MKNRFLRAATILGVIATQTNCQAPDQGTSLTENSAITESFHDAHYVRISQAFITREFVERTNFIRDHKHDDNYAFGYLNSHGWNQLRQNERSGIKIIPHQVSLQDFHSETLISIHEKDSFDSGELTNGYHDYQELTTKLKNLAEKYPSISQLSSIGQSVRNRELWMMKISDQANVDENEPKLLYIANMHGDEVVGREMMIYLIEKLLNEYETSARVRNLVDHSQIFIVPSMNPDGFEAGSRFNGNGKDLNRNFPDFTTDPSDTMHGRQPETQAIMRLHDQHHFLLALNFHGGAVCFNLPWDTSPNQIAEDRFEDDPLLWQLGRNYADTNSSMLNGGFDDGLTYGYEWYEVNGGMQDWASHYRRSIHATVELSRSKWPSGSNLPKFWQDNEEALIAYLESGLTGAHLKVVNEEGDVVPNVTITTSSSVRQMRYDTGLIHRPTLPIAGQKAMIKANGFEDMTIDFDAQAFADDVREVTIHRQ